LINIFLSFAGSQGAQQFEKQPTYTEVNPGEETFLSCKIYQKKGQCSWQKDGKVSLKIGHNLFMLYKIPSHFILCYQLDCNSN